MEPVDLISKYTANLQFVEPSSPELSGQSESPPKIPPSLICNKKLVTSLYPPNSPSQHANKHSKTRSYAHHRQFLSCRLPSYCRLQTFELFTQYISLSPWFSQIIFCPSLLATLILSCCLTNFLYICALLVLFHTPLSLHIYSFNSPFISHSHCVKLSKACL